MKKFVISALLLPLCSCINTDIQEKQETNIATVDNNQEIKQEIKITKSSTVTIVPQHVVKSIETENIPEYVENVAKTNILPINAFDKVAMQMTGQYVADELKNSRTYYAYMKFFDREWARLQRNSISHISAWTSKNINPLVNNYTDTVFYPFGGPDIIYALSFFPDATNYVLVGLEPIGRFSDIEKVINRPETFDQIRTSLRTYLRGGYFITSEMLTNLSHKFLRGTMYLILLELSALNFEINNVEDLSIDPSGNEVARGVGMIDCVKITCTKRGEQKQRSIYYVRADLSDNNKILENLFNFVKKTPFHTYFKSASYAIWDNTLSNMRNFVLENSQFILQDDTGIPFAYFDKKWEKYAFGTYTEPNLPKFFRQYKQPMLVEFFENNKKASIPFKIGYGFYQARPNLLLAISKTKQSDTKQSTETVVDKERILEQVEQLKDQYKNADKCKNCGKDKKQEEEETTKTE
ncbi:MAG: hypothetical protein IJT36_05465 [Alphaproteobacteria bacterium]|nr:hypothetical protein [Alphaproteobacteria bacterium]